MTPIRVAVPGGAADVVTRDINNALDLLAEPLRLKATLRD